MSILAMAGVAALLANASSGGDLLAKHSDTLKKAESLSVVFTVEEIPAAPVQYRLVYSKPNMLRYETPTTITITDGKTLWEYSKKNNEYTERPGDMKEMLKQIQSNEFVAWAAFFIPEQLAKVKDANVSKKMSMKGNPVTQVDFTLDSSKSKVASFYIDDKLGVARGASVRAARGGMSTETIVKANEIVISDKPADTDLFAFEAPAGAKKVEIAAADMTKWYHNLEEGLKVAKATNRMVFIDFNASWCGPCQMYKQNVFPTEEFLAMGKYFVFVDIDTDEQPALARQYGVSGIPDLRFLKSDGTEVHKVVGYKGMAVLQDFDKAREMNR